MNEVPEVKVLDHGHIRLIDHMGDDKRIVDSARVSYQTGTKKVSSDRGLIRYLLRNLHTTPFEKVRFEFHVKLPIFVARQWMRHRMGCLGGNVKLNFDLPSGEPWKKYSMTVEEVHRKWHTNTRNEQRPDKQGNPHFRRDRIKNMNLRSYDEETGEIYHTHIKDIWETGEQEVFDIVLNSGAKIQLTNSHQILTQDGWMTLGKAREIFGTNFQMLQLKFSGKEPQGFTLPEFTQEEILKSKGCELDKLGFPGYWASDLGVIINWIIGKPCQPVINSSGRAVCSLKDEFGEWKTVQISRIILMAFAPSSNPLKRFCLHKNGNPLDNKLNNLYWGDAKENSKDMLEHETQSRLAAQFVSVSEINSLGRHKTYDLEVEGPHHNFSANDIIVHNSFNEVSARYSVLPNEFYIPEQVREQSATNRQGSSTNIIDQIEVDQLMGVPIMQSPTKVIDFNSNDCYETYEKLIDGDVARELARSVLPLNIYTEFYWTVDLWNLMHFLRLRLDTHAQYEIRVYAEAIVQLIQENCDLKFAMEAFKDYIIDKPNLTKFEMNILRKITWELYDNCTLDPSEHLQYLIEEEKDMSDREKRETKLFELLGINNETR